MERVYGKSEALLKVGNRYCPGCFHSMANKLVAQCIEELGLREKATGISFRYCADAVLNSGTGEQVNKSK